MIIEPGFHTAPSSEQLGVEDRSSVCRGVRAERPRRIVRRVAGICPARVWPQTWGTLVLDGSLQVTKRKPTTRLRNSQETPTYFQYFSSWRLLASLNKWMVRRMRDPMVRVIGLLVATSFHMRHGLVLDATNRNGNAYECVQGDPSVFHLPAREAGF